MFSVCGAIHFSQTYDFLSKTMFPCAEQYIFHQKLLFQPNLTFCPNVIFFENPTPTTSEQLLNLTRPPSPSRPGTKYAVRGNPSLRSGIWGRWDVYGKHRDVLINCLLRRHCQHILAKVDNFTFHSSVMLHGGKLTSTVDSLAAH